MMLLIVVVIVLKPGVEFEILIYFYVFITCTNIPHIYIQIMNVPEAKWVCKHVIYNTRLTRPHIVHLVWNTHKDKAFG